MHISTYTEKFQTVLIIHVPSLAPILTAFFQHSPEKNMVLCALQQMRTSFTTISCNEYLHIPDY